MSRRDPSGDTARRFALKLLGRRVRRARLDSGLSRQDVQRSVGISIARLSNIENGYAQIKGSELFELAEAFGQPFEYFIAGLSAPDADGLIWVGDRARVLGRYDDSGRAIERIADDGEVRSLIRELANALSLVLP